MKGPRYSPVGPIEMLRKLSLNGLLDGYLLILAHDILKDDNSKQYRDLLGAESWLSRTDGSFVVVDNGVIELGAPLQIEHLVEAAELVVADCIVLPDQLKSRVWTQQKHEEAANYIAKRRRPPKMMKVPQGDTIDEVLQCVEWHHENIKTIHWGVPRWMANDFGSRSNIVSGINRVDPYADIHLLGMSQNWEDDMYCCGMENVMGIDSANPLVHGLQFLTLEGSGAHLDRDTFWEDAQKATSLNGHVMRNVSYMHRMMRDIRATQA